MVWETPSFSEIDMSAEIGAYQGDFEPSFAHDEAAETDGDAQA